MNKQDEKYLIKLLQKYCNKEDRILDIGCGIGENLRLLKIHNYNNIYGVDISQMMVEYCKNLGFRVYEINQIEALEKFDVLLFAHVLEHINYPEIKTVLENYFSLANANAKVIIVMPILYDAFYNDVDHVKPYYVSGLLTLFSNSIISKQYFSTFRLDLIDLYFRKKSLLPYNLRCLYLKKFRSKLYLVFLRIFFKLLQIASFNILSKTIGYTAIFKLHKQN